MIPKPFLSCCLLVACALCLMSIGNVVQAQPDDTQTLVAGNTEFAFKLYQAIRDTSQGNLFYSPYSISEALAMTYAGARGDTARQMQNVLAFSLPPNALHPAFLALRTDLISRGDTESDKAVPTPVEGGLPARSLRIADALWGEKTLPFDSAYLDLVRANYGAGLQPVDFINAPEAARQTINDWVAKETQQRIKDIVPSGAVTPSTRLVLANAIYFKNAWQDQFEQQATSDDAFTLLDGSSITVPMMHEGSHSLPYMKGADYQAVDLPYAGNFGSMLIILPDSGQFESVEKALDARLWNTLTAGLKPTSLRLSMPRFNFTAALNLTDTLQAMGMADAFSGQADFTGMGPKNLAISAVLHKAFIAVDENGTEAAAATAVVMVGTAMQAPPPELVLNRPFIFAIRDAKTGAVLFVGRVLNPAASS